MNNYNYNCEQYNCPTSLPLDQMIEVNWADEDGTYSSVYCVNHAEAEEDIHMINEMEEVHSWLQAVEVRSMQEAGF
jgi:hypothetical protein